MLDRTGSSELVAVTSATIAGLIYVDPSEPGFTRRRVGKKGFAYYDTERKLIRDREVLARIRSIGIPPAYVNVWICPHENGHIQAIGIDARGRRQYRYHAKWNEASNAAKFERLLVFAQALPALRETVAHHLRLSGLKREKVLATVVRLLETTLIRIGNDEYARTNKSFGLTTLQKRHVHVTGAGAVFEFRGKSGKWRRTGFKDRRLARLVRSCTELRGQRLFQFIDEAGEKRPVESSDVNDYLHAAMGEDFTAKDFRTWAGTLAALEFLQSQDPPDSEAAAKRVVTACVKEVSTRLGNTPAVCRACYIHPAVPDAYAHGDLPPAGRNIERVLLKFLEDAAAAA
jgi:DNA topoisomerase-1